MDFLPQEILCHIFSFLSPKVLHTTVSLVCKDWLEIVRNGTKSLVLKKPFLKKYFQLHALPIDDGKLNSLMDAYLKMWPNVQKIEMDWIGKTPLEYYYLKDSPNWLCMVRNEVKFLKLKEYFLKKYFQLDSLPINYKLLNSLMNDYMKSWLNVEKIQMDWIGSTSLSMLPSSTNFKQLWNAPQLKCLKLEKRTSTNSEDLSTPPALVGNSLSTWSYSYSSSSSTESQYYCKTFRF